MQDVSIDEVYRSVVGTCVIIEINFLLDLLILLFIVFWCQIMKLMVQFYDNNFDVYTLFLLTNPKGHTWKNPKV